MGGTYNPSKGIINSSAIEVNDTLKAFKDWIKASGKPGVLYTK